MTGLDIRWSTDIVTFFDPGNWGLASGIGHPAFERAVDEDPRPYFDRMLDESAAVGLSGIELAPAPGGWVNALRAYGSAAAFAEQLASRGLELSGSYILPVWLTTILGAPDADARAAAERAADDETRRHAEFIREVGGETLITSTVPRAPFSDIPGVEASEEAFDAPSDPELLDQVAALFDRIGAVAAESGVHVAIHTDAYSLASRPTDVDRIMAATDPTNVRLAIDAGHISLDGADALEVLRRHADRAPVLHWKDCAAHLPPHTLSGPPMVRHDEMIRWFRVIGDGNVVDWRAWTAILRQKRWRGWGVAEIDMSPDPQGEIRAGIEFYERELAG
jgi:inosose dehydratase